MQLDEVSSCESNATDFVYDVCLAFDDAGIKQKQRSRGCGGQGCTNMRSISPCMFPALGAEQVTLDAWWL